MLQNYHSQILNMEHGTMWNKISEMDYLNVKHLEQYQQFCKKKSNDKIPECKRIEKTDALLYIM